MWLIFYGLLLLSWTDADNGVSDCGLMRVSSQRFLQRWLKLGSLFVILWNDWRNVRNMHLREEQHKRSQIFYGLVSFRTNKPAWLFFSWQHFVALLRYLPPLSQSTRRKTTRTWALCFLCAALGGGGGGCIAYHQVHKDDGNHENKDDKSQVRQSAERKLVVQIRIQEVVLVIEFAHHHDKRLHHGQRQVLKLLLKLMKEENVKIIYGPMTFFFFFFSTMCG